MAHAATPAIKTSETLTKLQIPKTWETDCSPGLHSREPPVATTSFAGNDVIGDSRVAEHDEMDRLLRRGADAMWSRGQPGTCSTGTDLGQARRRS